MFQSISILSLLRISNFSGAFISWTSVEVFSYIISSSESMKFKLLVKYCFYSLLFLQEKYSGRAPASLTVIRTISFKSV